MKKITAIFPGKKALVVEDHFVNRELFQDLLELMGLQVQLAENGKEALELFKKTTFDVILMDVQMPEMDGFQTTKEIRSKESSGFRVPIIAITASALAGDKEKCISAGMDDYISKPVDFEKLEEILKKYLQA